MLIESYEWFLNNRDALHDADITSAHRGKFKQGVLGLIKRFS
jgi:hypothetical protein